jgi:opacity protein-like surface antigen
MARCLVPLLLAAGLGVPALPAWAEEGARAPYVSVSGMWVIFQDADLDAPSLGIAGLELSADNGWGVAGAIGYRVTRLARVEAEISYRVNDLDALSGGSTGPLDGEIAARSAMLNGYLDVLPDAPVHPYIGVGLGASRVTVDSASLSVDRQSDTVLAYQGMVGLSGRLGASLTLFGGYRYFATTDPRFDRTETEYRTHNAEIGIRVVF